MNYDAFLQAVSQVRRGGTFHVLNRALTGNGMSVRLS